MSRLHIFQTLHNYEEDNQTTTNMTNVNEQETIPLQPDTENRRNIVPHDVEAGSALLLTAVLNILILCFMICITTVINDDTNSAPANQMNGFLCFLLWTTTTGIIFQTVKMWRHRETYSLSDIEGNRFLLNLTAFFFMPLTQAYLVTQIVKEGLLIECKSMSEMLKTVSQMLFIAAVTGYILTLSGKKIVGTMSQVRLCRGTIIAVVTTSVCLWIQLLSAETKDEYEKMMNRTDHSLFCNASDSVNIVDKLQPYLSPFMKEFLLVASVLLYIPYQTAKSFEPVDNNITTQEESSSSPENCGRIERTWRNTPHNHRTVQCKRVPVIFGAGFVGVANLLTLVIYITSKWENSNLFDLIYKTVYYTKYFTYVAAIVCTITLYLQVRRYSKCECKSPAERILLWISASGIFLESVIYMHGITLLLTTNVNIEVHHTNLKIISVSIAKVLRFFQITCQTVILDVSLHRKIQGQRAILRNIQPSLILLFINIGYWTEALWYTQTSSLDPVLAEYGFGFLYAIGKCLHIALYVLYRIQSVVLLYQLFKALG